MYIVPTKDSKKEPLSDEERDSIATKIEGHIFESTCYMISAVWGYMISKDTDWMPWFLGGHG